MRKLFCMFLVFALVLGLSLSATAAPAKEPITTTTTGYDSADDVQYKTYAQSGKTVIANWGARGETCVFLSTYAEGYYTGDYVWDVLSQLSGGTTTSNTPSSDLYGQLQDLMEGTHTFYTYYDGNKNVRDYYCYTDCVSNDITQVGLLYRGGLKTSEWNQGSIWNQEHVWPKSKLSSDEQIGDIMHLRPANPSENSSRGNTAYGEGSGYYDPGVSVRGDCARMVLYMYVRWGATGTMWGKSGVIESVDILLKWMEEDPVDTWEMGRNDAVESITGVRNVFVDYPEYAWLLFGEEIPEDMVTPSGEAMADDTPVCTHNTVFYDEPAAPTCGVDGYTGDRYCVDCGVLLERGEIVPATGEHTLDGTGHCTGCDYYDAQKCTHANTKVRNKKNATCGDEGYSGDTYCRDCGELLSSGSVIPATGEHTLGEDGHCTGCDYYEEPTQCTHENVEYRNQADANCGEDGYSGDAYCADCEAFITAGSTIPATGNHVLGDDGHCTGCDYYEEPTECPHENVEHRNQKEATCVESGHTGDAYCADCGELVAGGSVIPATGEHSLDESGSCTVCGYTEKQPDADTDPSEPDSQDPNPQKPAQDTTWIWIAVAVGGAAVVVIAVIVIILVTKKKKN